MSANGRANFEVLNRRMTTDVVNALETAGRQSAVIVEAPPGAGKSTLTASVAESLVRAERGLRLAVVTQTNEQADDLVSTLVGRATGVRVARLVASSSGPSAAMAMLASAGRVSIASKSDDAMIHSCRIIVGTARKWQYERSRLQGQSSFRTYPFALIDEAYQMRSDALLGVADLFDTLLCVGDPGQLDPFTTIDDSLWKGLPYAPSRTALGTLRLFHPNISPMVMPTSWRLPPSAAGIISSAFYPHTGFDAGTSPSARELVIGRGTPLSGRVSMDLDGSLEAAARSGWAYVELPEKLTVRTDLEVAGVLAGLTARLLKRGATVVDERVPDGRDLTPGRVAIVAAHNDQVHAVRYELSQRGVDPDSLVVSTANKIQGREYDVVLVWHPLAGRRDATSFHLEAGRMCVMLSRHRQACIVVGRAGASRLLAEFPDSEPVFLDEDEKFPDGWQANHQVLEHLALHKVA